MKDSLLRLNQAAKYNIVALFRVYFLKLELYRAQYHLSIRPIHANRRNLQLALTRSKHLQVLSDTPLQGFHTELKLIELTIFYLC